MECSAGSCLLWGVLSIMIEKHAFDIKIKQREWILEGWEKR